MNYKKWQINFFLLILSSFILFNVNLSNEPSANSGHKSKILPHQILKKIETQGELKVLHFVLDNPERAETALSGISSGNKEWLAIYSKFRNFSDGFYTKMLDDSLAYGISKNPSGTLQALSEGGGQADQICGYLDFGEIETVDEVPIKLVKESLTEIDSRINALGRISSEDMKYVYDICMEDLKKKRHFWSTVLENK